MATIRNARDLLLQAAPSRYSNPPNAAIILTASSPVFHVASGGAFDPASITFTASLIGLTGPVTFVPTGGTLTVVGNVATLTYANMPGSTASVSATLTENGQAYASNPCSVTKVLDGVNGTVGLNNARVFAYQRAATAPTLSPGDVTVTFASNSITAPAALLNGWVREIPTANGNPLYVTAISGAGTGTTVALASASWSAAAVMATDGPGGTGANGTNGLNAATIMIFQRSASATALTKPSVDTTYTFATGVLSGLNNGWTQGVPAADPAKPYLQTTLATAVSASATDTVPASEWAAVQVLARDGTDGTNGTNGTPGARGAGHFYAIGTVWSDSLANAATPGDNVVDDVVTVSAADGTYALEKKWTGAAWAAQGQVIDGALLVTGSVNAAKINGNGLTIKTAAGVTILDAGGGGLQAGFEAPGTKNSDIVVGGRNLVRNSSFEKPITSSANGGLTFATPLSIVGSVSGTVALFIESGAAGTNKDAYFYWNNQTPVVAGRQYVISYWYCCDGGNTAIENYIYLSNNTHIKLPDVGVITGSGNFIRNSMLWTCPTGVTTVQFRFGMTCTGYSWLAVDCVQIEEGNKLTAWAPATEDAQEDITSAQDAANAANAALVNKLNKNADDILGGVLSINAVTAPAGFRAGSLTWNSSGARTAGNGVAMTPQGLLAYNSSGVLTFFVNATNGDAYYAGQLAAAYGSFGAVTIAAGGSLSSGQTAYNVGTGFWLQGGSTPKFSLKTASGASFLCDPANNILQFNGGLLDGTSVATVVAQAAAGNTASTTLASPPVLAAMGDVDVDGIVNGSGKLYASLLASTTGGTAPYTYAWSISGGGYLTAYTGAAPELRGNGFNSTNTGRVDCISTDATGRTSTTSFAFTATHGS